MKKLEELCISPTPWEIEYDDIIDRVVNILDASKNIIVETDYGFYPPELPDARLMKAAPELYECLREAAYEYCHACENGRGNCPKKDGDCFVQKWRAALAKASGERADNLDNANKE